LHHGRLTANGERFNTHTMTAAHRTLPFGTRVRVTHQRTGKSVVVRINDRGPFVRGRVIDLSKASAQAIGMSGVAPVRLTAL
jgi:rare lipoprotein A